MEESFNMLDYIHWRGDLPISHYPLNEVDYMIFARLSYLPFARVEGFICDTLLPFGLYAEEILGKEELRKLLRKEEDEKLLVLLLDALRFKDLMIGHFREVIDKEKNLQFSALTLSMGDDLYLFSFMGTDASTVGIKEDLNMTFTCPVEAQMCALNYFQDMTDRYPGNYILLGHSKGGNEAVFAAAFSRHELKERILSVVNFDGPGFDDMILQTPQYALVTDKVHTYLPEGSLIGILLGRLEDDIVVSSHAPLVLQHDLYTWQVDRDHFVRSKETNEASRFVDRTLRDVLKRMDKSQREAFVEAIFTILDKRGVEGIDDFRSHGLRTVMGLLSELSDADEETRHLIRDGLMIFVKSAAETYIYHDTDDTDSIGRLLGKNVLSLYHKRKEI